MTHQRIDEWSDSPVPDAAVRLFKYCWQLENWLRVIVYVEARARRSDWETTVNEKIRDWPPRSLDNDKKLHHMATAHQSALSYLSFSQLWDIISADKNWPMFSSYFPPKANAAVRIEEIKAIRNRIAHFRTPHERDIDRLELFLKDFEDGLRRFCSRYTTDSLLSDTPDEIIQALELRWPEIGYGIELHHPWGWLYAQGSRLRDPLMNARIVTHCHDSSKPGSLDGLVYRITVMRGNHDPHGVIDAEYIVNSTKRFHSDVINVILENTTELSVTIPAVLGIEKVVDLFTNVLKVGLDAARGSNGRFVSRKKVDWPEYVLWPDHYLVRYSEAQDSLIEFTSGHQSSE